MDLSNIHFFRTVHCQIWGYHFQDALQQQSLVTLHRLLSAGLAWFYYTSILVANAGHFQFQQVGQSHNTAGLMINQFPAIGNVKRGGKCNYDNIHCNI